MNPKYLSEILISFKMRDKYTYLSKSAYTIKSYFDGSNGCFTLEWLLLCSARFCGDTHFSFISKLINISERYLGFIHFRLIVTSCVIFISSSTFYHHFLVAQTEAGLICFCTLNLGVFANRLFLVSFWNCHKILTDRNKIILNPDN